MLSNLFLMGLLCSLIAIMVGFIRPPWVKVASRKKVLGIYGIALTVCFIGFGVTHEKEGEIKSGQNKMQHTTQKRTTNFESQFTLDKALPYEVVFINDNSIPGRKRATASILINSNNATHEQKAQTVFKAACDIAKSEHADVVVVSAAMTKLTAGNYQLALCQYAPNGGGFSGKQNWTYRITASKDNPTAEQLMILDEWYTHRHKFQNNGMTDEPRLEKFLSQYLGLPKEKITLPYLDQTKYYL